MINWCEYDGVSDPIVVGRDEDCDDDPGDEPPIPVEDPGSEDPAPEEESSGQESTETGEEAVTGTGGGGGELVELQIRLGTRAQGSDQVLGPDDGRLHLGGAAP